MKKKKQTKRKKRGIAFKVIPNNNNMTSITGSQIKHVTINNYEPAKKLSVADITGIISVILGVLIFLLNNLK